MSNQASKLTLHQRLIQFHEAVGTIRKTSTNPHFRSKFADINAVLSAAMPVLTNCGIIVSQIPQMTDNGGSYLETIIYNVDDKEDHIKGVMPLAVKDKQNPQQFGSALTYMRRYSLVSMLQLESADDDGNNAAGFQQPQQPQQQYQRRR